MLKKPRALSKSRLVRRKSEVSELAAEYRYASHHHLIPLYVLSGITLLAVLVIGCFIGVLWQNDQRDSFRPLATNVIQASENLYVPTVVQPAEKKQYIYSANLRFPVTTPYDSLRYAYDPGIEHTPTSVSITLTTNRTLEALESPILQNPQAVNAYSTKLQECARLYVIRFVPGVNPFGNFTPLKDVRLKDGRTAYIHKNSLCVPESVQSMNQLDDIENSITAVESY